jgi:hypothetical protein
VTAELDSLTRDELNARAAAAGVDDAAGLPNKQAVIDAIRAAEPQPRSATARRARMLRMRRRGRL